MKKRYYCGILYEEHLPRHEDLDELIASWHLPVACSPLHQPDEECRKAHYHVIIDMDTATSEDYMKSWAQVNIGSNGTVLFPVGSPKSYYRYLTHKDNPEKEQFDVSPALYGGFVPCDLDVSDVYALICSESISSYAELVMVVMQRMPYMLPTVTSKAYALNLFMRSLKGGE